MRSTKPDQALAPAGADNRSASPQDDAYELVRLSFIARLRSEADTLATLSTTLADARRSPDSVFTEIREFAHRLRGAAAVFNELTLSDAARALECAAIAASEAHPTGADPVVTSAIQALTMQLDFLNPPPTSHPDIVPQ
jgi:chemotaxis protein histidine kinase CheA